jgi:hypothetical protein
VTGGVFAARTPVVPRPVLAGGQSTTRIVYAELDVKSWTARLPTPEEVRPASCPSCGAASRPAGGRIVLHGHGRRTRHQWGPPDATAPPDVRELHCRRYHCQRCAAVLQVVPRGVLRRRLYSAASIALALAMWGVENFAPAEVRRSVSPWRRVGATAAASWASLRRWARAIRAAVLFARVRAAPADARLREVAARAATTLAAFAPSSANALPLASRAMLGAAHVS